MWKLRGHRVRYVRNGHTRVYSRIKTVFMRSPDGEPRSNAVLRLVHDPLYFYRIRKTRTNPQIVREIDHRQTRFQILRTWSMISRGILVLGDDSVIGEARSDRIPLSLSLRDTDNRGVKPSIRRIPSVSPFRAKRSIQARSVRLRSPSG